MPPFRLSRLTPSSSGNANPPAKTPRRRKRRAPLPPAMHNCAGWRCARCAGAGANRALHPPADQGDDCAVAPGVGAADRRSICAAQVQSPGAGSPAVGKLLPGSAGCGREHEVGIHCLGASSKKVDGGRQIERRHFVALLGAEMQPFAAGCQTTEPWAYGHQFGHQGCRIVNLFELSSTNSMVLRRRNSMSRVWGGLGLPQCCLRQ